MTGKKKKKNALLPEKKNKKSIQAKHNGDIEALVSSLRPPTDAGCN